MNQFSNHPLYKKHDIDSAMSSFWSFYKNKFVVLFFTSFVMSLVIQYISSTLNFNEMQTITDPAELFEKLRSMIWPIVMISLISLLFTSVIHYYIIYNPVDESNTIFVSALKSLRYYIPYLIILILFAFMASFAMVVGLLLLIIGIFFAILYMATLYLFILPILMVEGPNIGNAISRTFTLAHRRFWPNIGWVAVFLLIIMVISFVTSALILLPFTGTFLKVITNPEGANNLLRITSSPLYIITSSLVSALYFPLMPILGVILYFNGRAREEYIEAETPVTNDEPDKVRVEDLYAKPYSDDHPEKPEIKDQN
jgi:hypothetical protein